MKKIASTVAALGIAVLTVAGCSSSHSNSGSAAKQSPAPTDLKANITYAYWTGGQQDTGEKALVAAFNKKYPNISVQLEQVPAQQYFTKLQTEAASNTLPDVFFMNMPYFKLYASNGQLAPVDNLVKDGQVDLSNYPDAPTKFYNYQGKQYAVPRDIDTTAIWVNKKIFAQAGLNIPASGWTWADFQSDCAAIHSKLNAKGTYCIAFELAGQMAWYPTIFEAGGSVLSADGKKSDWQQPETQAGIQFWADVVKQGYSPSVAQLTQSGGYQFFDGGKAAMYPSVPGLMPLVTLSPDVKDFVLVPMPVGKDRATVEHSLANVVSAKSKHLQAAQAFQAFLASKEAQTLLGQTKLTNPAYNGTQQAFVDGHPGMNVQVFEDEIPYAKPLPASMNTSAWETPDAAIILQALSGKISVAEAASQLTATTDKSLAKEK